MSEIVLYDYWRSSASYRLRIALNLAGITYHSEVVDLLKAGHKTPEHLARNPQGLVPALEIDGQMLTQSLAILTYLDTTRELGLLPSQPVERARIEAAAHAIAVDLHPVCNLSVMKHATGGEEPARTDWMQHFIRPGLEAFEALISKNGPFCFGDTVTLADICLIPQLYNADRWGIDYSDLSRIVEAKAACDALEAFQQAAPEAVNAA